MLKGRHGHAALWLCVDRSSSIESLTRCSLARSISSSCLDRGTPRRSHISIALRVMPNRSASRSLPPSRSTIVVISAIASSSGTISSQLQELSVPTVAHLLFHVNDNDEKTGNRRVMPVIDPKKISETAFARFRELMTDMGWRDDTAIKNLYREIARPLGVGEKAVKMWFDRREIPAGHIFNVALVFGIDASWLAGTSNLTKEEATDPHGLYGREMDRVRDSLRKRRA